MANCSLTELANFHATDKGTVGPSSKWMANNYTDIYEGYLGDYRCAPVNILEIGLGVKGDKWDAQIVHGRNTGGASLKMWYDYFPQGKIYGIDVNACPSIDNDRIKTFVADQGDISDLERFANALDRIEFDFIVDDGSHRPDHQQVSLSYLFKKLRSGGLYFIEDLHNNGFGDKATGRGACNAVISTRRLLRHYIHEGIFLAPNSICDENYLKERIGNISFHAPQHAAKLLLRRSLRRPFVVRHQYIQNSELLCVIRKN